MPRAFSCYNERRRPGAVLFNTYGRSPEDRASSGSLDGLDLESLVDSLTEVNDSDFMATEDVARGIPIPSMEDERSARSDMCAADATSCPSNGAMSAAPAYQPEPFLERRAAAHPGELECASFGDSERRASIWEPERHNSVGGGIISTAGGTTMSMCPEAAAQGATTPSMDYEVLHARAERIGAPNPNGSVGGSPANGSTWGEQNGPMLQPMGGMQQSGRAAVVVQPPSQPHEPQLLWQPTGRRFPIELACSTWFV